MSEKVQVKVIELDKAELKPGAKYIFLLHPRSADWELHIIAKLTRLIGADSYTLLTLPSEDFKAYEVVGNE